MTVVRADRDWLGWLFIYKKHSLLLRIEYLLFSVRRAHLSFSESRGVMTTKILGHFLLLNEVGTVYVTMV